MLEENRRLKQELSETQYENNELKVENSFLKRERMDMLLEQSNEPDENILLKNSSNDDPLMIKDTNLYTNYDFNAPRGCFWRISNLFGGK